MSDQTQEVRFVREIVFGKKGFRRYWEVTTDPETLPENSTSYVMTEIPSVSYKDIGNLYGCRNWDECRRAEDSVRRTLVESAINQSKNELGWADFRFTYSENIEKWWEVVSTAYLLVSLFTPPWRNSDQFIVETNDERVRELLTQHPDWDSGKGWKNFLNNLRLITQPFTCFNLILRWLKVFPIPQL